MFGIFSNKISVEAILKGKKLDKAIEKGAESYRHFFAQNKPRKTMVGFWLKLFEDDEWIYWGYPKFRMIFSNKRYVDELYKTRKADL